MTYRRELGWLVVVAAVVLASCAPADESAELDDERARLSYAFGIEAGNGLQRAALDIDPAAFGRGLEDALAGRETQLSAEESRALITEVQERLRREAARIDAQSAGERAAADRAAGEAFLAANRERPEVTALPSGLQYEVLTAGDGPMPALSDTVVVHYRGTLVDGAEFDSSYQRGEPATLRLNQVIRGWGEALQLMPVGSRWRMFIPPDLAYGARGAGDLIGPEATLIFDVELLEIAGGGSAAPVPIADLEFSFMLHPGLTRSLSMGNRWVSPRTYVGAGGQSTVRVRVSGVDAQGQRVNLNPRWIADDPELVEVTPSEGNEVEIRVTAVGESRVVVEGEQRSEALLVRGVPVGDVVRLEVELLEQ